MDTFYSYLQLDVLCKRGRKHATCALSLQCHWTSQIIPDCNMMLHYPVST